MKTCDQDTAIFMSQALLNHAKDIHRYAKTYCAGSEAVNEEHEKKYARTVTRMINSMHALMLMAQYKGISRFCNQEQIDAYVDAARAIVSSKREFRQSDALYN